MLYDIGWQVLRFWEHEDPVAVVDIVAAELRLRGALVIRDGRLGPALRGVELPQAPSPQDCRSV